MLLTPPITLTIPEQGHHLYNIIDHLLQASGSSRSMINGGVHLDDGTLPVVQ
jgi:hypothetical protein